MKQMGLVGEDAEPIVLRMLPPKALAEGGIS